MQKSLRKFARFKNSLYLCRRFRENHLRRWAAPQHKTSFLHPVCTILAPLKKDRDLAQLVAHTSGGREVAGSSPVIPTEVKSLRISRFSGSFLFISLKTVGWWLTCWLTRKVNQEVNQRIMDATISVVCYKSKVLSNGESPIMVRVAKDVCLKC